MSRIFTALILVASFSSQASAQESCLSQKASLLMNSGRFPQAISLLMQAIRQQPADLSLRRQYCTALLGNGQAKDVLAQLDAMAQSGPASALDLSLRAQAFEQLGENLKAQSFYKQALSLDQDSFQARMGLARSLLASGKLQEAKALCYAILRNGKSAQERNSTMQMLELIRNRNAIAGNQNIKA